jgi:predicted metal-dependent peptidase
MTMQARELTGTEQELVENALILARSKRPYYAMALAGLKPYAVDGLGTVGVDKLWRLYVDPVWFEALDRDHRANIIAGHEIEHLLRRHPRRHEASGSVPMAWNIAADCEINDDCGLTWPETHRQMPKNIGAEDGLTAEEYLKYLEGSEQSMDCGSGAGGGQRPWELPDDGTGMTKESEHAITETTAQAVLEHIKQNGRGSVPAGILMWAEEQAKGKLPPSWDRQFSNVIGKLSRELRAGRADYSYSRLHRRTRPEKVIRPASVSHVPRIGLVVDTSGSMVAEGSKVLATVRAVIGKYQTLVIDCDAEVSQVRRGTRKIKFTGGGGTDLRPAMELAQRRADAVVVVTDCDTPWPDKMSKPVIVVATNHEDKAPDWAKVVHVKSQS